MFYDEYNIPLYNYYYYYCIGIKYIKWSQESCMLCKILNEHFIQGRFLLLLLLLLLFKLLIFFLLLYIFILYINIFMSKYYVHSYYRVFFIDILQHVIFVPQFLYMSNNMVNIT